ncbi:hypothetical protein MiSe_76740 [Microseira wollei NIES-4236]|uniref:Uncharacterized protein n=1 Tax=Microseira wollei NIES-4236 TaxID=2530354 RepID=A0AAV3XMN4_9CYAN|nr:hypothetical protein MiSe_76740 [Microseira wollei NIES-4236]
MLDVSKVTGKQLEQPQAKMQYLPPKSSDTRTSADQMGWYIS